MKILVIICLGFSIPFGLSLPLHVTDSTGIDRMNVPVWNGVPLPKGLFAISDTSKFAIQDSINNNAVPAGFYVLGTWGDGSIRWLGVHFQATVSAKKTTTYLLTDNQSNPIVNKLTVTQQGGIITVNTGVIKFKVKSSGFNIIDEAWVDLSAQEVYDDAHQILSSGNSSKLQISTATQSGTVPISIEYKNQEQVCIKAGPITAGDHQLLIYLTAYRNKPYIKIFHNWYYNKIVSENFSLTNLSINYQSNLSGNLTATFSDLNDANNQTNVPLSGSESAYLYYDRANSYSLKKGSSTLGTGLGQTAGSEGTVHMGWVHLSDGSKGIGGGVRYFWQMSPKDLEVSAGGSLKIGLYSQYANPLSWYGGFGRTHATFVSFGKDIKNTKEGFYAVTQPLMAIPPAVWLCGQTKVFGNTIVHGDPALFSTDPGMLGKFKRLFDVYDFTSTFHGYLMTKNIMPYRFGDWIDLHNFINFGDNVDPINSYCGGRQHFGNNYYDMPYMAAISFALTANYHTGLWGLERALHTADMDHNNTNGRAKGCPGVEQFYGYQTCTTGDWDNTNHWKAQGIFQWYYLLGEPLLKELGLRLCKFPLNVDSSNSGGYRSFAHALTGLSAAYEATWDTKYKDRARWYYTNGERSGDAVTTTLTDNYFQNQIVGEGIAYHLTIDTAYDHGKQQLISWANIMAGNPNTVSTAFSAWSLAGFAKVLEFEPANATVIAAANSVWNDFISTDNLSSKSRAKDHVMTYKALPQYLKYLVLDINYLDNYPDYVNINAPQPNKIMKNNSHNSSWPVLIANPNPFNSNLEIKILGLSGNKTPILKIYNIHGILVKEIGQKTQFVKLNGNSFSVRWQVNDLPSGVYLIKLQRETGSVQKQVMFIK